MDKVKCEPCGGTGRGAIPTPDIAPTWKPECPTCQGEGERPITVEDLREAWNRGERFANLGNEVCFTFNEWLQERYGIREGE